MFQVTEDNGLLRFVVVRYFPGSGRLLRRRSKLECPSPMFHEQYGVPHQMQS